MFTADQVWGLAVAADRINGGYCKEEVVVYENECRKVIKEANKQMVKTWLRQGAFSEATAADTEKGREIRNYFNGFLLKQISGKINDFEAQALRIAQMDEFTTRNMLEFAIVSCLPSTMLRDQARKDLASQVRNSTQLHGNEGEVVQGTIEVVSARYSQEYNKYRINAKLGDAFVDFWYGKECRAGDQLTIKGKIKSQRGDKTTQLNYVKKV
jgi:hypothetical protein